MKNFYQGPAMECEFCHRKFKEDELVIVTDLSRKVFCCIGGSRKDQLICARGFKAQNPAFMESATVMTYRGGPCSCVDKNRVY